MPLDGHPQAATAAIAAFWHHVRGQSVGCAKAPDQHLRRARLSLVALDGHHDGASYRTLAEQLFGATRVAGETWRTSSLRDATIRLVRTGVALSRSDYRRLLGQKIEG